MKRPTGIVALLLVALLVLASCSGMAEAAGPKKLDRTTMSIASSAPQRRMGLRAARGLAQTVPQPVDSSAAAAAATLADPSQTATSSSSSPLAPLLAAAAGGDSSAQSIGDGVASCE